MQKDKKELVRKGAEFLQSSARLCALGLNSWTEAIENINYFREAKVAADFNAKQVYKRMGMRVWKRFIR